MNNVLTVLGEKLLRYISNPTTSSKLERSDEILPEIKSELIGLDKNQIIEILNFIFEKFKHINRYYKENKWWESANYHNAESDRVIQLNIQISIIRFFRAITNDLPESSFKDVIPNLTAYGTFTLEPVLKNEIFNFLIRLSELDALEFCKSYIIDSMDYDRHKSHIFHNYIVKLVEVTPFFQEVFDFILEIIDEVFTKINPNERTSFIQRFRGYFVTLVRRNLSLGRRLVLELVQSQGDSHRALMDAVIEAGRFPEQQTCIISSLIEFLTANDLSNELRDDILGILKSIHGDERKNDKGMILSIILEKANSLSGIEKSPLKDLFNALFQLIGDSSPQWREAVNVISTKIVFDADLAQQKTYIKRKLSDYGLENIELDYERFIRSCERDNQPSLETLRNVLQGVINFIISKIGGKIESTMKETLKHLEKDILKTTAKIPPPKPNRESDHKELLYSNDLWGLLSHYGSHPNPADDIQFSLFISTLSWIYLLLRRYEKKLK